MGLLYPPPKKKTQKKQKQKTQTPQNKTPYKITQDKINPQFSKGLLPYPRDLNEC